ncbi:interferon-induced protein with tetratricopeptide repeats 1-like [Pseudoliparis swirei]|uniref:interferon-induced protein with tetratricopeptide repeats 1-like n=1 Tax=Pseudoliparis swirei TaxID=2059687 RepID=UPI0024BDC2A4|nr:interferon-induced protein with tetratricopeptide repeats 1-like [Pseudoliparis swirei]
MMACSQSKKQLVAKLEALQCHFTWNMETNQKKLLRLNDMLVDIGTEEGNSWLGHIYNLQGFIQYQLGSTEDAQSFFNKAAEAFRQMRKADDGPWLVVNYGNLAWLHHHLGDQAESEAYLSKVDALMKKYPSPSQDELHAETYAEKAWTLMKFSNDRELVADYFQRAIKMQPEMVEWNTSYVLGLVSDFKYNKVEADILEKMRVAQEQDPENFYLAACYLEQRGKKGEDVKDEARELAVKILRNPFSSCNGMKAILNVYSDYISIDEAIALAEEALELHPDERYLKRCAALCLKWKIIPLSHSHTKQSTIDRAVSLLEEVISLYPHSSLVKKIDLANIHAKSNNGMDKADQMYQDLLIMDLEPVEKQLLYNKYATYLHCDRKDHDQSVRYHMKAAEIPEQSFYRANSIKVLEKFKNKSRNRKGREIEKFLENLQEP